MENPFPTRNRTQKSKSYANQRRNSPSYYWESQNSYTPDRHNSDRELDNFNSNNSHNSPGNASGIKNILNNYRMNEYEKYKMLETPTRNPIGAGSFEQKVRLQDISRYSRGNESVDRRMNRHHSLVKMDESNTRESRYMEARRTKNMTKVSTLPISEEILNHPNTPIIAPAHYKVYIYIYYTYIYIYINNRRTKYYGD